MINQKNLRAVTITSSRKIRFSSNIDTASLLPKYELQGYIIHVVKAGTSKPFATKNEAKNLINAALASSASDV